MTESEQRYLEVLMEEMNGKFSLVLEGHAAFDEKMEQFHKEAKEDHHLAMDLIKHSHDVLKEEIQVVDRKLTEEIQAVDRKLTAEIRDVDRKLTAEIRDVGKKVEGHEDRIRFLERKVA